MKNLFGTILVASLLLLPGVVGGVAYGDAPPTEIARSLIPVSGPTIDVATRDCGPETMTQCTNPSSCTEGSVACATEGEPQYTTENSYARCYAITQDITINCVDFGVESCSSYAGQDYDVTVTIYKDTDGACPPDLATLESLGSVVVTIPDGAVFEIFTADFNSIGGVFVPAGTKIVVEVYAPDRRSGTGEEGTFFIGSNAAGQSAASYLYSASCLLDDYVTFASVGYPNVHIVQRIDYYVGGEPPVGACCLVDGSCLDTQTYGDCGDAGGVWQGADTLCATANCPQPPTGACCDGLGYCTDLSEYDCVHTWLGEGTACGDDCDGNGTADICVLALDMEPDCNGNQVPDACDISAGTSQDLNDNGIPDECEPHAPTPGDMNCDGIVDYADIDPFVEALSCVGGDPACWPHACPWINADCNDDLSVTYGDIDAFVALIGTTYAGELVPAELAGNSLSEYPYFEYVKAFNQNATVEVAVDPTRYPGIVGRTADIYIVEAKSVGAWLANPTLVDVTPGGAQTETFAGTTIQQNTFTVTGAFDLSSIAMDACTGANTGLGHGYDVVIDVNRNGQLDGGDFIDGFSKEAGLYICDDTSQIGPLAVTETAPYSVGTIYGIPSGQTNEELYFPTNIASMDCQLPLVVISHGNGHQYIWYDHIGYHMASHGYIVMTHNNDTVPGIETCSLTTCGHTDAVIQLGQSGMIPGAAAIAGKIDTHRIIWIGHSRGAEGVARAYDRITDTPPSYTPTNYGAEDIIFISSMLPTDFLGTNSSNPHDANYHLWVASGDADVSGDPSSDVAQSYHLHDRATKYRACTTVQGTGHAWFHDGGGTSWFTGPCPIGEEDTHLIQLGLFLPMIKYYAEGNVPATDYFWRQYEHFRPPAVGTGSYCSASQGDSIVVNNTYRNGADDGNVVIDDYQTGTSLSVSSSGGAVTYTVTNVLEDNLDDGDTTFTWTSSDPMNGFTYGRSSDSTRGVVFDWNADRYYEWTIIPPERDLTDNVYLSFRAAQQTRHPYTIAELGDVVFDVSLRDAAGHTSTINIGAYGGGVEEPYQRTSAGTGTGWGAEFEVIRIRVADFLTNGSGLDLSNVEAIRLDFGPSHGSAQGRIGLDSVMLTNDYPAKFVPLTMTMAAAPPEFLPPNVATTIDVVISEGNDTLVAGSAKLHYSYNAGVTWNEVDLVAVAGELHRGTLPAPTCADQPWYYLSAEGAITGLVYQPTGAPDDPFVSFVGTFVSVLADNFQTDQGWTVESDPSLTGGEWERAIPSTDGSYDEPMMDFDGSGYCFVTQNSYHGDVDYGPTMVISPTFDLSGLTNPVLRYARWWANDDQDDDPYDVEIGVYNTGSGAWDWYLVEHVVNIEPGWTQVAYYVLDYVPALSDQMRMRVSVNDTPNNSRDEAALDAVEVFDVSCP